ncbi:MAG: mannosyltransferase, partial [Rhizonema sp. PD37]|nr:mannosyltransferase [Rhizonema sp. PD37]
MTNKKILTILSPLIICSAFILCAAVAMLMYPETFHKFFSPRELPHASHSYYWDVELYARKALNPNCDAFYPLWPFIIRTLFHPQTVEQAAHDFLIVATTLFFTSTVLLFWIFKTGLENLNLAFLLVLAYTVNPTSIFRVIGYTESLFATFSTLFIWIFLPQSKLHTNLKLLLISVITFLMALTRPVLIQLLFASTATLITIFTFEFIQLKIFNRSQLL